MSSHKVAQNIRSTVYPFDYNKNNPMSGFNEFALNVKAELVKTLTGCELTLLEAKKILINIK
jgi:hypothetical protein